MTDKNKTEMSFLDHLEESHIMGTVAGENTVLVIPESMRHIQKITENIQNIMQTKRK